MRVPAILFAALVLVLSAASCSKKEDTAKTQPTDAPQALTATPVVNSDDQLALATAEKLTEQFTTNLQRELSDAVSETGPAGAMSVCGAKASAIMQTMMGGGWALKRVTQRPRNVSNKADTLESQILGKFVRDTSLKYQATWVLQGAVPSGMKAYMYYKPIYVNELCLNCHGDPQTMDPKVVAALADKYPADQALGYKAGDMCGMLVVSSAWPTARARAEAMAKQ